MRVIPAGHREPSVHARLLLAVFDSVRLGDKDGGRVNESVIGGSGSVSELISVPGSSMMAPEPPMMAPEPPMMAPVASVSGGLKRKGGKVAGSKEAKKRRSRPEDMFGISWLREYWAPLNRSKYEELRGWWAGRYGLTVRGLFGLAGDSSEFESEGWTLAVEGRRSRHAPRPLYAPSLGRLTSFARSCCLFRSEYDAFASLYGSLESKSWESLKSIKLHDFGRCNLAYVELSTIITMFFDWPYGHVDRSLEHTLARDIPNPRKRHQWITGCLLSYSKTPLNDLVNFCVNALKYKPIPGITECFKFSQVPLRTYLRRTACPQAAEQLLRNLTRMPTVTPAEFIELHTRRSHQAKQDKRGNELTPENFSEAAASEAATSEAAASEAAASEAAASEAAGRNLVAAGRSLLAADQNLVAADQNPEALADDPVSAEAGVKESARAWEREARWFCRYWEPFDEKEFASLKGWLNHRLGVTLRYKFLRAKSHAEFEEDEWSTILDTSVYVPSLSTMTDFASRCEVFDSDFDAHLKLLRSLSVDSWKRFRSIKVKDFSSCRMDYLEMGAIVLMFFKLPYGTVAPQTVSLGNGRDRLVWITGCLLQYAQVAISELVDFCINELKYKPRDNGVLECLATTKTQFRTYIRRKLSDLGSHAQLLANVANLPVISARRFMEIKRAKESPFNSSSVPSNEVQLATDETLPDTDTEDTQPINTLPNDNVTPEQCRAYWAHNYWRLLDARTYSLLKDTFDLPAADVSHHRGGYQDRSYQFSADEEYPWWSKLRAARSGMYIPMLCKATNFGFQCGGEMLQDGYKSYLLLHSSLSSWEGLRKIRPGDFESCSLAYVELATIISAFFVSPYGLVDETIIETVARKMNRRSRGRRLRYWIQGCLLQKSGTSVGNLIHFCILKLRYNPKAPPRIPHPNFGSNRLECLRRTTSLTTQRYKNRPCYNDETRRSILSELLAGLPVVTAAEFGNMKASERGSETVTVSTTRVVSTTHVQASGPDPILEPQLAGDEPQVAGDEPQMAGDEPQVAGDEPQVAGDEPQVAGDEPQVAGDEPIVSLLSSLQMNSEEIRRDATSAEDRIQPPVFNRDNDESILQWSQPLGGDGWNLPDILPSLEADQMPDAPGDQPHQDQYWDRLDAWDWSDILPSSGQEEPDNTVESAIDTEFWQRLLGQP
ncbi:hypothetical protein GNI_043850 [Gregarina niphandrodes]|uniref:Uncharacterized protein n=1 Tax=Gregarina niphandrodes TaxID=110365 RepID=A0A023B9Z1_GRENI|nr:hypothetical protein GNI_043850 [Gregarina niphandrodes]EZG76985.1 hypothetical protein GNI_043850 [Gregarina niphandrodes]|eukprot:XP_011129553.1 hypothetical protein GNI_043850 [Gregarina niphandrodes]